MNLIRHLTFCSSNLLRSLCIFSSLSSSLYSEHISTSFFRINSLIISPLPSFVTIKQLAAWWILEEAFDNICVFLGQSFGTIWLNFSIFSFYTLLKWFQILFSSYLQYVAFILLYEKHTSCAYFSVFLPCNDSPGGFTLRERQNSRVRVEITANDASGVRRRLASTYFSFHYFESDTNKISNI